MDDLTKDEIRELWKLCGFRLATQQEYSPDSYPRPKEKWWGYLYPTGEVKWYFPSLTLDNLFRYATPLVLEKGYWIEIQVDAKKTDVWMNEHTKDVPEFFIVNKDPAQALARACLETLRK